MSATPERDGATMRPARSEDERAIVACVAAAYGKYRERMGRLPAPMLADYAALIGAGDVWVLETAAGVIGALVMRPADGGMFIENVAVLPSEQGRGYGRRLLAHAESAARVAGLDHLALYTNELMTENLAYYPTLGFRQVERRVEDGFRRVYMRKDLATGNEVGDERNRAG